MKRITHLSIQNHGGVSVTPLGVILSALAECESQDLTLYEKALHIDNALAIFVRSGYEIKFCSDEYAMLIFEHSSEKE